MVRLETEVMNTPDQDTLFRAVMDARSILSEHDIGSAQALEWLRAVLDRADRMKRKPVARLERGKPAIQSAAAISELK